MGKGAPEHLLCCAELTRAVPTISGMLGQMVGTRRLRRRFTHPTIQCQLTSSPPCN
ncbi:protein of unknown function [Bradyrhizobium sp. ORS 285]|nr:protein of unknown function [Bradyrhizobium sp. ORS 285]